MSFVYSGATKNFRCNLKCDQCEGETLAGERCKKRTCRYLPTCYIHTKKKYGLLVKKSSIPNAGDGLYALKEFKQGEFIADYKGEVLTKVQRDERYGRTQQDLAPYAFQASQNKIIDSACHRYIGAYANSKPNHNNATFSVHQGKVKIKATKKIKVGDEVFLSYGASYFTHGQGTTHTTKKNKIKI